MVSSVFTLVGSYAFSAICCVMVVLRSHSPSSVVWILSEVMMWSVCFWSSLKLVMTGVASSIVILQSLRTRCLTSYALLIVVWTFNRSFIVALAQSISGLNCCSQGYPKIIQSFPRSVMKNWSLCSLSLRVTYK
jgi:hypothetical protein